MGRQSPRARSVDVGSDKIAGYVTVLGGTGASDLGKAEDAPHASGDVGVMLLGVRNDALAAFVGTDGDYSPWSINQFGAGIVAAGATSTPNDGISNAAVQLRAQNNLGYPLNSYPYAYNGITWDRERNNVEGVALASAARTASTASPDITNHNARGIMVMLDVTAASGTGGLQVRVQAKDPVSGNYLGINSAPTAITAVGMRVYVLYPGANTTNTGIAQVSGQLVPRTFRIFVSHGDGSSYTYSVGYALIR